jgi:hypothetical protein
MNKELQIPKPIAAFIEATNQRNTDAFLAAFTDNAVITDEGSEYRGIAAIKKWSDEKNIGAEIRLTPVDVIARDGKTVLTAEVNGNFDKTGLPDPFLMDLHFTVDADKINGLNYRLIGE